MGLINQLKHAWNAFTTEPIQYPTGDRLGLSYNPNVPRRTGIVANDRSIVTTVVNRMSVDVSMIDFFHADTDDNGRYVGQRKSGLNYCLNTEANIDQSAFAFKNDIAATLFDKGHVAVVPVDTTVNPDKTGSYEIHTMRVGYVSEWHPRHVKVELYNDKKGIRESVYLDKRNVAIIQNPLYSIMNEPNSTLQRLIRKLKLLDDADESLASNKLDMIIQLPYVIKSEARRQQAEQRRKDVEFQLAQGKYGIAYTDGTEKITQLNRPIENNLLETVEKLTIQLYSQLGLTKEILEGSASEEVMNNYYRRTIEPVAKAIAEEFSRTFLTRTARSQGQIVMYLRSQFDFVAIANIADIGDKMIRNEILTPNELRGILGFMPSGDPDSDEIRNRNMPVGDTANEGGLPPPNGQNGKDLM